MVINKLKAGLSGGYEYRPQNGGEMVEKPNRIHARLFHLSDFTKAYWSQLDVLFSLVPPRLCSGGERRGDDILRVSDNRGLSGLPPGKHSCSICCGSVLLP